MSLFITKKNSESFTDLANITGSTVASLPFWSTRGFLIQSEFATGVSVSVLADAAQVRFYSAANAAQLLSDVASGAAEVGFITQKLFDLHPDFTNDVAIFHRVNGPVHIHDHDAHFHHKTLDLLGGRTFSALPSVDPRVRASRDLSLCDTLSFVCNAPSPRCVLHKRQV